MAGNSVIGALRVVLGLDSAAFSKGLSQTQRDLARFGKKMQAIGEGLSRVGQTLTVGLTLPIVAFGAASVKAAQESADAFGQVSAALKSMGGVSGRTLEQLGAQADSLMRHSLFDDDDIMRNVTANMLTFGNIAGENFDRAQQAVVDMATRLKMDLQPATIMIGKALNDPVKGLAALGRAGIQFTAQQKEQIKAMVAAGNAAGAQSIMLAELNRQFGGAAQAAQDTQPFDKFKDALNTLQETIGAKILPILTPFIESLTGLITKFSALPPQAQGMIVAVAGIAAALGPLLMVLGPIVSGIGALIPLLALPAVAVAAPWIALAAAVGAVIFVFRDDLAPVIKDFADFVAQTLGPKLMPLIAAFQNAWTALAGAITKLFAPDTALGTSLRFFGELVGRVFKAVVSILGGAIDFITGILNALAAGLRGDWSAMWGFLGDAVFGLANGIVNAFGELFRGVGGWLVKLDAEVKKWLVGEFHKHAQSVQRDIDAIVGGFRGMWDAVVGHSYVPDMILGIEQWFARLDAGMVKPAKGATDAAAQAFETLRDRVAGILEGMLTDEQAKLRQLKSDIEALQAWIKGHPFDTAARDALGRLNGQLPAAQVAAQVGPLTPAASMSMDGFGDNGFGESWTALAGQQIADAHLAALEASTDRIKSVLQAGWSELMSGDLKGALSKWFQAWAAQGMENALNSVSKLIADLFSSMGSASGSTGGGGFNLGSILSGVGKLFGFAQGGSFEIGGSGGIDSKIAMMKVTPGETGAIWKKGQGPAGGGAMAVEVVPSPYFDVRVREVSGPMASQAAAMAVKASSSLIPREQRRRSGQRLGMAR